jgi:uncharacterized membrane protein YfcA
MDPDVFIFTILFVIFLGAFTRATLGFGDALVAMPLLAMFADMKIATPVVAFEAVVIATLMLIESWRKVDFRAAWRLILASIAGIPFGLMMLKSAPEGIVKSILGIVLILFGIYNLLKPDLPALKSKPFAYLAGFLAGILGGAYNTNGPPVIIYGTLSKWSPTRFRATLQCYFVPTAIFILIGNGVAGLWTPDVLKLFAYSFPVILLATFLGTKLSYKIPAGVFDRYVYAALIVMGLLLFI